MRSHFFLFLVTKYPYKIAMINKIFISLRFIRELFYEILTFQSLLLIPVFL